MTTATTAANEAANDLFDTKTTFKIPAHRIGVFQERFANLQKRARKLGCPAPACNVGPLTAEKHTERDPLTGETWTVWVEFYPVTVAGDPPKFNGWTFDAVIDYEDGAGIVRQCSPGEDLPARFRTLGPVCEHCRTNRKRKEVFVVRHDGGRTIQVGRQCIRDFLGHQSPESIASAAELVADLHASHADDELVFAPRLPGIEEYLSHVARVVRMWGWKSRGACLDGETSTASAAWECWETLLKARKLGGPSRMALEPTPEDVQRAAACLQWVRELGASPSDYIHNLRTACALGLVRHKNCGIVASAVSAHDRVAAARAERRDEYVGAVGDRLQDWLVRVVFVRELEPNEFGPREMIKMRDSEGRTLVWFTSPRSLQIGAEHFLTGKIKKHSESERFGKETLVSHCDLRATDAPTRAEVRAAEKLYRALNGLWLSSSPFYWTGWRDFEKRLREAHDECDLVTLEALRGELHSIAGVLEPRDEPTNDAELEAVKAARAELLAASAPPKAKRTPSRAAALKPAPVAAPTPAPVAAPKPARFTAPKAAPPGRRAPRELPGDDGHQLDLFLEEMLALDDTRAA